MDIPQLDGPLGRYGSLRSATIKLLDDQHCNDSICVSIDGLVNFQTLVFRFSE